jgi:hypothetical protein
MELRLFRKFGRSLLGDVMVGAGNIHPRLGHVKSYVVVSFVLRPPRIFHALTGTTPIFLR